MELRSIEEHAMRIGHAAVDQRHRASCSDAHSSAERQPRAQDHGVEQITFEPHIRGDGAVVGHGRGETKSIAPVDPRVTKLPRGISMTPRPPVARRNGVFALQ